MHDIEPTDEIKIGGLIKPTKSVVKKIINAPKDRTEKCQYKLRGRPSLRREDSATEPTSQKKNNKKPPKKSTLDKNTKYSFATAKLLYYSRIIKKMKDWTLISRKFFPESQNDISTLKKQWESINKNPKALARIKNSTEKLLARRDGSLDDCYSSADGRRITRVFKNRFSDISTSVIYYARIVKQMTCWVQIAKLFFPYSQNNQSKRLRSRWELVKFNRELFEKTKKNTEKLLRQNNGSLDNYIVSSDECQLEVRKPSQRAEDALTSQKYVPFTKLEENMLYYAQVWKNMSSWRDIEQQFYPKSIRAYLQINLAKHWPRLLKNKRIRDSTEKLVKQHGGSLDKFVLSPDGSELVVCKNKPPVRFALEPRNITRFTILENNFIYYARMIKKMSPWAVIARNFFPNSSRKHMSISLTKRWYFINKNPSHLKAIEQSTQKLIKQHGGSLDQFILSSDGSKLVARKRKSLQRK
ncbi:hypothetical protein Ciccas_011236 [Cichlidogyrus casuarinus]|uniref:Uncharacterized protein n=1 Tax=Cichlidogyrus casuarinus TaxID=1844966 RepID=A0ABD2PT07_9PLAT